MTQRTMIGAVCVALVGLAALIGEAPRLVRAKELHPAQNVPRPVPLAGTEWMLVESRGQHVSQNGWQPHFKLKTLKRYQNGSAGQVEGVADSCSNDLTGTYRVTANRLRFEFDGIAASLRACKCSKDMPCETIGALLNGSPQFRIHGDELDLLDNSGEVRARLIAASGK